MKPMPAISPDVEEIRLWDQAGTYEDRGRWHYRILGQGICAAKDSRQCHQSLPDHDGRRRHRRRGKFRMETQIIAITPSGRIGQPDDVALPAVFLASDDARYITGDTLFVAGGAGM
jgi:hypothetical protein